MPTPDGLAETQSSGRVGGTLLPLGQPFTPGAAWRAVGVRRRDRLPHRLVLVRQAGRGDGQRVDGRLRLAGRLCRPRPAARDRDGLGLLRRSGGAGFAGRCPPGRGEPGTGGGRYAEGGGKRRPAPGGTEPNSLGASRQPPDLAGCGIDAGRRQGQVAGLAWPARCRINVRRGGHARWLRLPPSRCRWTRPTQWRQRIVPTFSRFAERWPRRRRMSWSNVAMRLPEVKPHFGMGYQFQQAIGSTGR